jgi:ribonuclease P/MRP protein subunit POP7
MSAEKPFSVAEELAKLKYEKKNGDLKRLPPNATIQKRPILHAPIASPYAGKDVQKVVYVSSRTPFMSAVKRVKKLLHQVEKRATQNVKLVKRGDRHEMRNLAEASDEIARERESVLVKASGKAITRALKIGEWFSDKEKDISCTVEVRSGSVNVVDDIVSAEKMEETESEEDTAEQPVTLLEGGDTTMELLGEATKSSPRTQSGQDNPDPSPATPSGKDGGQKAPRRKRKRPAYAPDDVPEERLRWVKTVEVAIALKG